MIISGTIFRLIVRHFGLLFYPRIAIVLTSVAAAVLLLLPRARTPAEPCSFHPRFSDSYYYSFGRAIRFDTN